MDVYLLCVLAFLFSALKRARRCVALWTLLWNCPFLVMLLPFLVGLQVGRKIV